MRNLAILCIFAAIGYASACAPGNEKEIGLLESAFGMKPYYTNGDMKTNGYNDDYIARASDLNCNFNTDETDSSSDSAPKAAAFCKWQNMQGERADLDTEQYYLFEKTDDKKWAALRPLRSRERQTPAKGDGFALTGGKGKPAKKSIYYSSPVACSENPTQLKFDYWIYTNAAVRVLLLEPKTLKTVWEAPANSCTRSSPRDGVCIVTIPPQATPYHLAIHGTDLSNSFVIIDNIDYSGDLGRKCEGGGDPFDFGTTGSALPNRNNAGPIVVAQDLYCNGANCKWANSREGTVAFEKHTAPVDADKWAAATGDTSTPTGDFFMAKSTEGKAELLSDIVKCQYTDGVLEFRAWASKGTLLEVCTVDADTLEELYTCETVTTPMVNGEPFLVPIFAPLENARFLFRASDWNAGNGGFVAIDDISYEATMCSEVPSTTVPIVTTTSPDTNDQNVCEQISTDFDDSRVKATSWLPYPQQTYQNRPVAKHSINQQLSTTQTTRVECPDGGLCAGMLLDKRQNLPVGIMQTDVFQPLQRDRYLQIRTRYGTYGTSIYLCADQLPNIDADGNAIASNKCTLIAGPMLTFEEYRRGKVTGGVLPAGTTRAYLLFTNPTTSGADKGGFLVDNIQVLKTDESQSGPLCEHGGMRRA